MVLEKKEGIEILDIVRSDTKLRDYLFGHLNLCGAKRDLSEEDANNVKIKFYREVLNIPDSSPINIETEENDHLNGNHITIKFLSLKTPSKMDSIPKKMYFEFKLLDKKVTTDHVTVYLQENSRKKTHELVTNQTLEAINNS